MNFELKKNKPLFIVRKGNKTSHMNYRDFYKNKAVMDKLKNESQLSEIDSEELIMGIAHEKEHTKDEAIATAIAKNHLREDSHYYSRMKKAGMDECGLENVESGLPKLGGALAIPHLGQPIHMSKIIQVGPALGHGSASGELSGFVSAEKKGVTKDRGGIPVIGDTEPITAGGTKVASSLATKSVGGPITPGEGQKQGGPNTKGTIAATAKLFSGESESQTPECDGPETINLQESHKKVIRNIVKDVLKEIRLNKETGKWEKLTENRFASMNPDSSMAQYPSGQLDKLSGDDDSQDNECNCGAQEGPEHKPHSKDCNVYKNEELDMKMGPSYKTPRRAYRTVDDDRSRQVEYEPEITERYNEEEHNKMRRHYMEILNADHTLDGNEYGEMKDLKERIGKMEQLQTDCSCEEDSPKEIPNIPVVENDKWIQKAVDPSHKGYCTPMTKSTCTPHRKALAKRFKGGDLEEAGGAAVQHSSYRTANDARQDPKNRHRGDIDEGLDDGGFVENGLKKLFQSGKHIITINDIDEIGMSYIKDVDSAGEYATQLAWGMAEDYDYIYDEKNEQFVKRSKFHIEYEPEIPIYENDKSLQETEKKSAVMKTIQKGAKAKKSTQKQSLQYKAPKKTKSGIHKKKDI